MMSKQVPAELVAIILKLLRRSNDSLMGNTVTNSLCVSSQWRDIGLRLLWTDVVVDSPQRLQSFTSTEDLSNLGQIESLTITLPQQYPQRVPPPPGSTSLFASCVEDKQTLRTKGNIATQ